MSDPISQTLLGGAVGKNLLKKMVPEMPSAKVAPVPDEKRRRIAGERAAQRKYAGAGRAGTLLTGEDKLG